MSDEAHTVPRAHTRPRKLACWLGLHSWFGDGCRCWRARRCNRCLRSRPPSEAARVDECRRLMGAGTHPEGACQGGAGRD